MADVIPMTDMYEGYVTRAVKDSEGDWWVERANGSWRCITDRADADDIDEIVRSYGMLDEIPS